MTSSACRVLSIHFPDPEGRSLSKDDFNPVPSEISYRDDCSNDVRILSMNDNASAATGFLYIPDISESSTQCFNDSNAHVPTNISQTTALLEDGERFDLVGVAPWISPNCSMDYLAAAKNRSRTRAMLFYIPDSGSQQPPAVNDPAWDVDDGGRWKSETDFSVYAVSGTMGTEFTDQMVAYLGDVDEVPFGDEARQELGPGFVKLFVEIETGFNAEMPELWVFVLVVLGVIGLFIAGISAVMHFLQYRRRRLLRRRIISGEVDLETIGITRITVPQNILDKMPTHVYNSSNINEYVEKEQRKESLSASSQQTTETRSGSDEKKEVRSTSGYDSSISSLPKSSASSIPEYSQPTCAICLDDYEVNSTTVRQLPCNHIFHPDCIDPFLKDISSLCPMCKKSVISTRYCPKRITNGMVRRERLARRARQRRGEDMGEAGGSGGSSNRHSRTPSASSAASTTPTMEIVTAPSPRHAQSLHIRSRLSTTLRPLSNLISQRSSPNDETRSTDNGDSTSGSLDHRNHAETLSNEESSDVASRPPPTADPSTRQAWTRQRARALLGRSMIGNGPNGQSHVSGVRVAATVAEDHDEETRVPRWRKVLTAVFPGFT